MELHHYMQYVRLLCYDYTSSWMRQLQIELLKNNYASELFHARP
jgi:hypothetical protein